ncbi:MAG TPA: hypothetical protein PLC47_05835, partial [Bacteroidales bacterium]|nr:hypothetical protein [Bacteroidales bacterium]
TIKDLISNHILRKENYDYDYIFLEIPSIIYHDYPLELMNKVDASLMLLKSSSKWNKADESALNRLKQVLREEP